MRKGIIELLNEININIQISKDEYDFIFQKFSKLYQKEENFLNDIKNWIILLVNITRVYLNY